MCARLGVFEPTQDAHRRDAAFGLEGAGHPALRAGAVSAPRVIDPISRRLDRRTEPMKIHRATMARDDDAYAIGLASLLERADRALHVVGIHRPELLDTEPAHDFFERSARSRPPPLLGDPRVGLVSRHRCRAVVHDDQHEIVSAGDGVEESCHAAVQEGPVTDVGDGRARRERRGHPRGLSDAGTHAEDEISRAQGLAESQRIATDIVDVDRGVRGEYQTDTRKSRSVGTPGTEDWRSRRERRPILWYRRGLQGLLPEESREGGPHQRG